MFSETVYAIKFKKLFPTHQFVTLRFDWLPLSIYNPIEREHIPSFNQKLKTYCRQQTEAPLFFFFSRNHVHWRRSALHYSDLPSSARQFGWAPHINFTVTDKTRRHQRTIEVPTRWNGLGSRKRFAVPFYTYRWLKRARAVAKATELACGRRDPNRWCAMPPVLRFNNRNWLWELEPVLLVDRMGWGYRESVKKFFEVSMHSLVSGLDPADKLGWVTSKCVRFNCDAWNSLHYFKPPQYTLFAHFDSQCTTS